MNIRHSINTNLKLHTAQRYNDLSVITYRGPLVENYLQANERTLRLALLDHPRTLAIRVDLRCPSDMDNIPSNVISKFTASLKAQISADLKQKSRDGKRAHSCTLRYVWAREQDTSQNQHYHVLLLLNLDTYSCLGRYDAFEGNMASRIQRAWASALGVQRECMKGAVYFPDNGTYRIKSSSSSFSDDIDRLFFRLSYFAKVETKDFGRHVKHFGCSRR